MSRVRFAHPDVGAIEVKVGIDPVIVGRESGGADVALGDGRVSRRHGRVWVDGSAVWYEDLGSSNGSWLDGTRLTSAVRVEAKRPIVLGETTLTLVESEPWSGAMGGMTLQMHVRASDGGAAEVLAAARPARYTTALYEFVQALLGSSSRELIARAVRIIGDVVPAAQRISAMAWPPDDDGTVHHLVLDPDSPPISLSLARYAVSSGEALLLAEAMESAPHIEESVLRHGIRSAIYVPLMAAGNEAIGVLCVDTPQPSLPFSADDFQFVRAVGGLLATALESERARDEARRIETEARELAARRDGLLGFLKIASHDLRNPLTVIMAGAQSLRRRRELDLIDPLTAVIVDAGNRAMTLIQTYLEIAALDEGKQLQLMRYDLDLRALVEQEIAFARSVGERLAARYTFVERVECERVKADSQRLRQILSNLLSNAMKYSPNGGEIVVTVAPHDEGTVFSVRDPGVGISAEDQARLFRQFERVGDNVAEGIGLGLWLTSALVAAHGGRIWVESAPDEGSTFSFTIPG